MAQPITDQFCALHDPDLPGRTSSEMVAHVQGEAFFQLAAVKQARIRNLRETFAGRAIGQVYLSANLSGFACRVPGCQVEALEKGFFERVLSAGAESFREQFRGAVVIVNNNDVALQAERQGYSQLYQACPETVFIAWDWDNHHWLELSTFLAAHADFYAPAHHENLGLLARYNSLTVGPVYCATVQWSRQFLADHLAEMLSAERSAEPLGKHIPYGPFSLRNRVVATLSHHFPSIGFSDRGFHERTPAERLREWIAHKIHWIVPVLNDVPIRIFDALLTGGIPIVPESLRGLAPVSGLERHHVVFYGALDVVDPKPLVAHANALFDEGGADGIAERHRLALDQHHGDRRVRQMLGYVTEILATRPVSA